MVAEGSEVGKRNEEFVLGGGGYGGFRVVYVVEEAVDRFLE